MSLFVVEDFSRQMSGVRGRLLGCDVGEKTIGLALSDESRTIATPFGLIRRTTWKKDGEGLLKIIEDHQVVGVVLGLPLNMNGTEGPRCQSIRQFAANLLVLKELPVCLWDERLSTVAVLRPLLEADMSRVKRSKVIDKMAASYILQGFLEALKRL